MNTPARLVRGLRRAFRGLATSVILAFIKGPLICAALAGSATNGGIYLVQGVLVESHSAGHTAVIAHESIPGYMDAMTMPFQVKKWAELEGIQPGDRISFRLSVGETEAWIDEIKKTGGRDVIRISARPPADLEPVKIGAQLPDCILTNHAGQSFHLSDFNGQAVALTFFFSRCPLPSFCPRMNYNFAAVQSALQRDTSHTNWQLLSVSFDPAFDTPAFLSDFAKLQRSDPLHWSFATSSPQEIRRLGGALGLQFSQEKGTFSHNLRTAVLDASGRVQKVFSGSDWKPGKLVVEMQKAMASRAR